MHRAKEYKRALNATKLDKVFAKPFIGALEGHSDGVMCLAKSPTQLSVAASGAADGEIRLWDVPSRRALRLLKGHQGAVRGLSITHDGRRCVSCGDDATVRVWRMPKAGLGEMFSSGGAATRRKRPIWCVTARQGRVQGRRLPLGKGHTNGGLRGGALGGRSKRAHEHVLVGRGYRSQRPIQSRRARRLRLVWIRPEHRCTTCGPRRRCGNW